MVKKRKLKKQTYEPHCPSRDCKGHEAYLGYFTLHGLEIPQEAVGAMRQGVRTYRCRYCGLLWGQKHRLIGFNPSPIGYWDKPRGAAGYSPLGKFLKVRAENETL